jgi:hypothetical protein
VSVIAPHAVKDDGKLGKSERSEARNATDPKGHAIPGSIIPEAYASLLP